jgi:hypothetical protein
MNVQGGSGGEDNIWGGGDIIGHYEKKTSNASVSISEMSTRYNLFKPPHGLCLDVEGGGRDRYSSSLSIISLVCLRCDQTALSRSELPSANALCGIARTPRVVCMGWKRSTLPNRKYITAKCTIRLATCFMHSLNHTHTYKVIPYSTPHHNRWPHIYPTHNQQNYMLIKPATACT